MQRPTVRYQEGDNGKLFMAIDFPEWEDDSEGLTNPEHVAEATGRVRPRNVWVSINGCMMHIEGLHVHVNDDGNQDVVNHSYDTEWDGLWRVYDPQEPFATATINDKAYVVYATPHGD